MSNISKDQRAFGKTNDSKNNTNPDSTNKSSLPSISLPKGGGAIRGIGEKFTGNPVTGTGSFNVPIYTSPGRSGFGPQLSLSYDSGSGNDVFGLGWSVSSIPSITRKTEKRLPTYQDNDDESNKDKDDTDESDIFILSGAEDLVPVLVRQHDGKWKQEKPRRLDIGPVKYSIKRYRPRIEGLFARIERWTELKKGDIHWRSISKDNITTLYGKTKESRIYDPQDPKRIFSWLICESYDDKGNAILYQYKPEDSHGVDLSSANERNRTDNSRSANRYLKRIKYGNKVPYKTTEELSPLSKDWMFELVFDYGENYSEDEHGIPVYVSLHDKDDDTTHQWKIRQDPFSSYRAGFEIRTYRLCQRVLMFHHFPEELGIDDYLVKSTEFTYAEDPIASFITHISQSGFLLKSDGTYLKKSLPPLEFEYTKATVSREIKEIDPKSLENIPYGLDGARYQWIDLDSEGLSGILSEQGSAWFYKHNLSSLPVKGADGSKKSSIIARFEAQEKVADFPSTHDLNNNASRQHLTDLTGDGQIDLVQLNDSSQTGYFKRNAEQIWEPFVPFSSIPNINWDDPNLKFVDLTGDGHPDMLITEDQVFTWYPSLAEKGFGDYQKVSQALNEEDGPKLVFADALQSIYLADMSGDGLTDLVRIRNCEICYWPNLGFGKFGAKVTMDNSPLFDFVDQFDNRRIRLVDADGSGTTDVIYIGNNGVYLYFNQSGNSWKSDEQSLVEFPTTDNLSSVTAVDLLGNGTACLVWSSPLPGDALHSMRYIDLMGGVKPHLLVSIKNNMGAETKIHYVPSTKFYLIDKYEGKPWITKLPFPVQVVERIEIFDWISKNYFVTRYAYHHGYFDGIEREFRGFGFVEQWDTEEFAALSDSETFPIPANIEESSHIPLVRTKTWFHTGSYFQEDKISRHYETEYYHEPGLTEVEIQQQLLADTIFPTTITMLGGIIIPVVLTAQEKREACRALKGSILRQEIYALDNIPDKSEHPYSVSEQNYTIELVQGQGVNQNGVFFVHQRESLDYHYERDYADPRISHALTLKVDPFGNILRTAAIGYGRRRADPMLTVVEDQAKQTELLITCTENTFTNHIDLDGDGITSEDSFRNPLPETSKTYQLTGLNLDTTTRRFFDFNSVDKAITEAAILPYEEASSSSSSLAVKKRLISEVRTIYRKYDLSSALPSGIIDSQALPFETYSLAFTPGLVKQVYGSLVTEDMLSKEGHYVHLDMDENWWIPSGKIFFSPTLSETSTEEVKFAKEHFYLPHRFEDPFQYSSTIKYDKYSLLLEEAHDPLDNVVTVVTKDELDNDLIALDYRVLQPWMVTDPNGNRTAVSFDILGLVALTSVMGKIKETDGKQKGDTIPIDLEVNLNDDQIRIFFDDPYGMAPSLLGSATSRIIYDVNSFYLSAADPLKPVYAAAIMRETHVSDLPDGESSKIQVTFSYSDGFGREIQKKIPAEPEEGSGTLLWVGSGWTVFNNKGKAVKNYEPFFSNKHHHRHQYEYGKKIGVSPTLFYDPLGRLVATLHPNYTYEKVAFDPWRQESWDVNDTVLVTDLKKDSDVGAFFARLTESEYLPTWYERRKDGKEGADEQKTAENTAKHAGTKTIKYLDTLGRTFLTIADNGNGILGKYRTLVDLDIQGIQRKVIDALGRTVMKYEYDILGNRIKQANMDAGERWMLNDVSGKPIYSWDSSDYTDSRSHTIHTFYDDKLQRPTRIFMRKGMEPEKLVQQMVYGETQGVALNHRGKLYQHYDGAGVVTNNSYDFKGNLLSVSRQLATEYKNVLDWSFAVELEQIFTARTEFDAVNRPVKLFAPDNNSIIHYIYNEGSMLDRVEVKLRGSGTFTPIVQDINYNAKGQRVFIKYGNGVQTNYTYDDRTFRLVHLETQRGRDNLQDLSYNYDPVGNITHIQDNSDLHQVVFFHKKRRDPINNYIYDAVYRLITAEGREYLGSTSGALNPPSPTSSTDEPRVNIVPLSDGTMIGNYTEDYSYDEVGNILEIVHNGTLPSRPGWNRTYTYKDHLMNNHLTSTTTAGTTASGGVTDYYNYDKHGNIASNDTTKAMPHLPIMSWNYNDQLESTSKQKVDPGKTPETTYYVYDASGQRIRKITCGFANVEEKPRRMNERIYLGAFEVYRRYNGTGDSVKLERETLHIMDDKQRIVIVETRTTAEDEDGSPKQSVRYQLGNHLGSASLELDDHADVISYEEYYPYGSTSYQAGRSTVEVSSKRYRYIGKERDEENGFYYHGARYYTPWLARWVAADPSGIADGLNLYSYVHDNPVNIIDPSGTQGKPILIVESTYRTYDKKTGWKVVEQRREEEVKNTREFELTPEIAEIAKLVEKPGFTSEEKKITPEQRHMQVRLIGMGENYYTGGSGAVLGQMLANWLLGDVTPDAGDVAALARTGSAAVKMKYDMKMAKMEAEPNQRTQVSSGPDEEEAEPNQRTQVSPRAVSSSSPPSSSPPSSPPSSQGPGVYKEVIRDPNKKGLNIQAKFSGNEPRYDEETGKTYIKEYYLDGVYFDRFKDGVLGEVKDDYSFPIYIASKTSNTKAAEQILSEAQRHTEVAGKYGLSVEWYVREQDVQAFQNVIGEKYPSIKIVPYKR
jgi:RHS repeat-associated protein